MARKVGNGLDLQNQKIVNVADPTSATDAANKQYVDNSLSGLSWKQPVRLASTTNGTLATAYANGSTLDGVSLTTGMRILLKDQTTGTENGIYTVNASGAPTRATDADSTADLQNATVYVVAGTVNADKAFTQTANDITIGTTALVFAQVGGGSSYTAGNGLTLTSGTFAVNADGTSVIADGTSVRINPAYSGIRKLYAADLTSGSTSAVMTHGLATADLIPIVTLKSTGEVVDPDILITSTTCTVTFAASITTAQYRLVLIG